MAMDAYIRDRARGDRLFGHVTPSPTHPALGWGEGEERLRQAYLAEHQNTAPYGVPFDPAGSNLGRRLYRIGRERVLTHSRLFTPSELCADASADPDAEDREAG